MRLVKLLIVAALFSGVLSANTILFGLLGDPNRQYTFTRTDTPVPGSEYPNWSVTVPAGPYPGWLGANIPADQGAWFCVDFTLTATFNDSYSGSTSLPSGAQELEAAYLAAVEYGYGGASANVNQYAGPISMAIWQIMDPTPGDVPRDPAAQAWVTMAQNLYNAGQLTPAQFSETIIFAPDNTTIQRFMLAAPMTPEPETFVLLGTGLLLIFASRMRKPKLVSTESGRGIDPRRPSRRDPGSTGARQSQQQNRRG